MSSPAGWDRDPEHADALRCWDGTGWTEHRTPLARRPPGDSRPAKPWSRRRRVLTGAALTVLTIIGAFSSVTGAPGPEASHGDTTVTGQGHQTPSTEPGPPPTEGTDPAAPVAEQPKQSTAPRPPRRSHTRRPGPGTALAVLAQRRVRGRAAQTGYDRVEFGQAWLDTDRNGCDTRSDILNRDLTRLTVTPGTNGCRVEAGTLADPYTGTLIRYVRGNDAVDIDHVVALSNAWQTGAFAWDIRKRAAFANDPLNLLAVDSGTNRQKGDADAATWLPPSKPSRCAYTARQVSIKAKYQLWVTPPERDAMARILASCPDQPALTGGAPTIAPVAVNQPHRSTPDPRPSGNQDTEPSRAGRCTTRTATPSAPQEPTPSVPTTPATPPTSTETATAPAANSRPAQRSALKRSLAGCRGHPPSGTRRWAFGGIRTATPTSPSQRRGAVRHVPWPPPRPRSSGSVPTGVPGVRDHPNLSPAKVTASAVLDERQTAGIDELGPA